MMSAKAMSAAIRAKKKKMEEDESGDVKLSGIPEDAQDIMVNKNHEAGEMLSENMPKEHDEEPTLEAEMSEEKKAQPHDEMAPNPKQINMGEEDDEKMKRQAKIMAMMARMGK